MYSRVTFADWTEPGVLEIPRNSSKVSSRNTPFPALHDAKTQQQGHFDEFVIDRAHSSLLAALTSFSRQGT
jgi:hypothetical protein